MLYLDWFQFARRILSWKARFENEIFKLLIQPKSQFSKANLLGRIDAQWPLSTSIPQPLVVSENLTCNYHAMDEVHLKTTCAWLTVIQARTAWTHHVKAVLVRIVRFWNADRKTCDYSYTSPLFIKNLKCWEIWRTRFRNNVKRSLYPYRKS